MGSGRHPYSHICTNPWDFRPNIQPSALGANKITPNPSFRLTVRSGAYGRGHTGFSSSTTAPGITAPEGSFTVPRTRPDNDCARMATEPAMAKRAAKARSWETPGAARGNRVRIRPTFCTCSRVCRSRRPAPRDFLRPSWNRRIRATNGGGRILTTVRSSESYVPGASWPVAARRC